MNGADAGTGAAASQGGRRGRRRRPPPPMPQMTSAWPSRQGEGPAVGLRVGVALAVGVGDGAGRRPRARGLEPVRDLLPHQHLVGLVDAVRPDGPGEGLGMGRAGLGEAGLRRGHRPQASPPLPLLHAGHGDLWSGPGGYQDSSAPACLFPRLPLNVVRPPEIATWRWRPPSLRFPVGGRAFAPHPRTPPRSPLAGRAS